MNRPYIAFEGIEGAGKSTVAQRVGERLEADGLRVVRVREPGGTTVGESIRQILLSHELAPKPWTEALLFAAARAQLAAEVVGPALDDGAWVLTDRSVYSSLAYQGAGRRLGVAEVRAANEPGLLGVWPSMVVLLAVEEAVVVDVARRADLQLAYVAVGAGEVREAAAGRLHRPRPRHQVIQIEMG